MTYSNEIDHYTKTEIDNDLSLYRVIRSDVTYYKGGNNAIDDILSDFRHRIDEYSQLQLFIKGNRLFFELDGVKYYTIMSCWAYEWQIIDDLLAALGKVVDKVAYLSGELD